jgi:hypothetical protein
VPAVLASNTDFSAPTESLAGLQQLGTQGRIRSYLVIERGGIKFGLFGVLGREAAIYSVNAAPATFTAYSPFTAFTAFAAFAAAWAITAALSVLLSKTLIDVSSE